MLVNYANWKLTLGFATDDRMNPCTLAWYLPLMVQERQHQERGKQPEQLHAFGAFVSPAVGGSTGAGALSGTEAICVVGDVPGEAAKEVGEERGAARGGNGNGKGKRACRQAGIASDGTARGDRAATRDAGDASVCADGDGEMRGARGAKGTSRAGGVTATATTTLPPKRDSAGGCTRSRLQASLTTAFFFLPSERANVVRVARPRVPTLAAGAKLCGATGVSGTGAAGVWAAECAGRGQGDGAGEGKGGGVSAWGA